MQRDCQDVSAFAESLLGTVAMMYVPVQNGDTINQHGIQSAQNPKAYVVKDAESPALIPLRMMTRRADKGVSIVYLTTGDRRDSRGGTANPQSGNFR
jgi:hypothetical protein